MRLALPGLWLQVIVENGRASFIMRSDRVSPADRERAAAALGPYLGLSQDDAYAILWGEVRKCPLSVRPTS
jgi:hypothetical protein